jgi:DNA primase
MNIKTELSRAIRDILSRISIVDMIGRDVQLEKRGKEYVGKCPFHNEKTASFSVNDEKGKYYCFGCGASGDAISYVMKTKGYSFMQAVESLSLISGIKLPKKNMQDKQAYDRQNVILNQLRADSKFFREQLVQNKGILRYCQDRGLDNEMISKFSLGYCPQNASGDNYKFRHRLIFPIFNNANEIIAFGGRALQKDSFPKYINSNESEIFCKKETLYAYNIASKNISKNDELSQQYIVVEGYIDAVIMHKFGFSTTVATMGTAFSSEHLHLIWRNCNEPIICFDGDEAGYRAMLRAAFLALKHVSPGKTLKFCMLPKSDDPDSFLKRNSKENMQLLLKRSSYLIDFIWESFVNKYEGMIAKTPEHIATWREEIFSSISVISDEGLKRLYRLQLENLIYNFLRPNNKRKYSSGTGDIKFVDKKNKSLLREAILLYTVIRRPSVMHDVYERMSRVHFSKPGWNELWEEVCMRLLIESGAGNDIESDRDGAAIRGVVAGDRRACIDEIKSIAGHYCCACEIDKLSDAEVLAFWDDVFENHVFKAGYEDDIKAAETEFQSKCDESTWRRLKALKLNLLRK